MNYVSIPRCLLPARRSLVRQLHRNGEVHVADEPNFGELEDSQGAVKVSGSAWRYRARGLIRRIN